MELPSGQCSVRWGQRQPAVTSSAPKRLRRLTTYRLTVTFAAAVLALAATLVSPLSAAAQEARATITGTVRDGSGGIIPGATVTITHKEMGTDRHGRDQRRRLLPGAVPDSRVPIRSTAELQGFKKTAREVEVRIADRLEVDLSLAVGQTVEAVTVTADTPLLETTNASLGNVVDSRRISQLPTPHGDPYALIGLAAGVTYTGSARLDRPFEPTHIVGYSMDGTRGNRSDLTIDGVPSTATANAGEVIASYVPPSRHRAGVQGPDRDVRRQHRATPKVA